MRESLLSRHENGMFWPSLLWLNSGHIGLALEDSQADSLRVPLQPQDQWECLSETELMTYHRQLFLWRIQQVKPFTANPGPSLKRKNANERD